MAVGGTIFPIEQKGMHHEIKSKKKWSGSNKICQYSLQEKLIVSEKEF